MIFYDEYSDVPKEIIERFVTDQQLGRLVTVSDSGQPHIGLYPSADPGSWLMEAVAAHPDLQGLHRPDVYAQGHTKGDGGQSLS